MQQKKNTKKVLRWSVEVLCGCTFHDPSILLFIAFSVLDVQELKTNMVAILSHMIPVACAVQKITTPWCSSWKGALCKMFKLCVLSPYWPTTNHSSGNEARSVTECPCRATVGRKSGVNCYHLMLHTVPLMLLNPRCYVVHLFTHLCR